MTLFWDDPFGSAVVLLYNMVPAFLPLGPGLAVAVRARRRLTGVGTSAVETTLDGAGAASAVLKAGGASGRSVVAATGPLATFYDPSRREIRLSEAVYEGQSPEALGVAAHEAGHALQDAQEFPPLRLRTPVVVGARLACGVAWMCILAGLLMLNPGLIFRGSVLYSAAVLALLALRPAERDANRRSREVLPLAGVAGQDGEPFRRAFEAATWADLAATLPLLPRPFLFR